MADMCEADCLQCISNTCVCAMNYGGLGEGVALNDCHLNERVINILWFVCLGVQIIGVCECLFLLWRWLRGGGIDWMKLVANRNFRLLCGATSVFVCFMLLAAVRVFAHSLAFNDVAGTIFFILGHMAMFINCVPLVDLCHDTLVSLLLALGVTEGFPPRGPWIKAIFYAMGTVTYIPVFASPALSLDDRTIMVQYSLIIVPVAASITIIQICIIGEKAMKLLASINTEATILPRRRVRFLLLNFYLTGPTVVIIHAVLVAYVKYYPWFLPAYSIAMGLATILPPLGLSYDPSRITVDVTKMKVAGTTKGPRRAPEDDSTTNSKPSKSNSPVAVEMSPVEKTDTQEPQKVGETQSREPNVQVQVDTLTTESNAEKTDVAKADHVELAV